jgi:transforming growth factor-beta-induced protein
MRTRTSRARVAALAAIASLSLVAAACGSDDDDAAGSTPAATDAGTEATTPMGTDSMTTEPMGTEPMSTDGGDMMGANGPACGSLPTEGEGSLAGMADDPAATAASNNPELSTLVAAVTAADLVDTLNSEGPFTIFAPVNSAFEKIPAADLDGVLADTDLLTSILTYHVVPEQLSSDELVEAGTLATVNGADLEVTMDGDTLTINGGEATVVCADVPTANATVYLIDSVLMPPADGEMATGDTMAPSDTMAEGAAMLEPSGPACATLPGDGEGSLAGMADDPAATAASNNPELSTLVAAVTAAGLVDTLNSEGPFTIFAPVNSAFAKIPAADLDGVLADTDLLTSILAYHVVPEQLNSDQLVAAGTLPTVNGAELTVAMDGDTLTINDGAAMVACADIPTANATVYLIDSVLMPPA